MIVFLWTVPRAVSTAFERAFMQRADTQAVHEPYTAAHYYGPERRSSRYADAPPRSDCTYAAVTASLLAPIPETREAEPVRFIKAMAYCIDGALELDALGEATHTFLIRHPQRTVPSLHAKSLDTARTGWTFFDPAEVGFDALLRVFRWAEATRGRAPVVVDADRLLRAPAATLQRYCEAIGLDFEPGMLRWEPGEVEAWRAWRGWHDAAARSAGLVARDPGPLPAITPALAAHVDAALPAYRSMLDHALEPGARDDP